VLEVINEYPRTYKKTMDKVIHSEFSGHLQYLLLAVVEVATQGRVNFLADVLYHAMKGIGTTDTKLINIIVSRREKDLAQIKTAFQTKYGKTLAAWIDSETSADYKKALLAILDSH